MDAARSEKLAKFSSLVAAIKSNDAFNVTYQSFEIGSFRQRLSDGSESAMKLLYNYITPKMTFDTFRRNLIDLVNLSSYKIFSSRNEISWDHSMIYPIPNIPDTSATESADNLYKNDPSVSKWVNEISTYDHHDEDHQHENEISKDDEDDFDCLEYNATPDKVSSNFDFEESNEIKLAQEESKEIKIETEKIQTSTPKKLVQTVTKSETFSMDSSISTTPLAATDTKTTMSIYQLLAILLIFCLILLVLNVMWNNLFTTFLICCVTLPILRWLGKV